ncbi:MAG: hypothetical protein ACRDJP_09420 [Actinomycetota bacterium]
MDPGGRRRGTDLASVPGGARPRPAGPESERRSVGWRLAFAVHLGTLAAGFLLLLQLNEGQWFFGDEWAFLADRTPGPGSPGLFAPHNEHWSTIPVLIYRGLFAVFGARTYTAYIVVLLLTHLAFAHLLWQLMRRSELDPWIATASLTVLLVFGPGADDLLWAFQIGFIGAAAFGVGLILLVDHANGFGRRDVAAWCLAIAGLMCSAVALPLIAGAGILGFVRRGWRGLLMTVGPPAVVFVVWFLTAGRSGVDSASLLTPDTIRLLPSFVWAGMSSTATAIAASPTGALVLAGLALAGLGFDAVRRRHLPILPVACGLAVPMLFLLAGLGRARLGLDQAENPRYLYIAAGLLLPILAAGITAVCRSLRAPWAMAAGVSAGVVLALVAAGIALDVLRVRAVEQAERDSLVRGVVLASSDPTRFEGPLLSDVPLPMYAPNLQLSEILRMRSDGDLPPAPEPTGEALLQAAMGLQSRASSSPGAAVGGGGTLAGSGGIEVQMADACLRAVPDAAHPRVGFSYADSVTVSLRLEPPGKVRVTLARAGATTPGPLELEVGEGTVLELAVSDARALLRFDPGHELVICGVVDRRLSMGEQGG